MTASATWAAVLDVDQERKNLRGSVLRHIRDAVREAGYVSRGRITSGIKEAYRPLGLDEETLRTAVDDAIVLLTRIGDIDELETGAGRGYAPTPPRRLVWGGADDVVLGALDLSSNEPVRRIAADGRHSDLITLPLVTELGRPSWRDALVELGGADQPESDATALSSYARALATSGERYSLDESSSVSVLSGTGAFFGSPNGPSGRWTQPVEGGFYPAVISTGYRKRRVLLAIEDGRATLWEPPTLDMWNWIVVGTTLETHQPVWMLNEDKETFDFLTPPPRQVERAALLTGQQVSAWSWRLDRAARSIIENLLGSPRT